jgi:hypothetical protein
MFKQIIQSIPTEQSQIWAFSRNIISGFAGLMLGIGLLSAAQHGELLEHAKTIIDSAQTIMVEVGKISAAIAGLVVLASSFFASFKASFKQQVETVADNKAKTEAVVLKDEALAVEIPAKNVLPASVVPIPPIAGG